MRWRPDLSWRHALVLPPFIPANQETSMALMFPRLARNFAKNGYYPTDEPTLERALNALMPSDGTLCILDPCAGEGVAIAEAAHALGRGQAKAFAVEFDAEGARHVGGLTRHYTDLRIYRAVETQFRQVVVFGRRVRQAPNGVKAVRNLLLQVGLGEVEAEELPCEWPFLPYIVPASAAEPESFFRVTMEPEQFADEVGRLKGLWPSLETHLGASQQSLRPPARALSHWHLALALAAGAISGVVRSKAGRVLVVKGDTHKDKTLQRAEEHTSELQSHVNLVC